METHKVELDGVTLHGYADMPDPFAGLAVVSINGWRGLPSARGSNDSIPGAHGSYGGTRVLRESRSIEVRGAAIAATEFEAVAMIDALEAEVAERPVTMWVHDTHGAWSRLVEVEAVDIVGAWNRNRILFAIDATAADPRRYRPLTIGGPVSLPTQTGGLILPRAFPWDFGVSNRQIFDLVNDGDIPVFPTLRITGSADSITVFGGAQRLVFGQFSGTLVFDSLQRRAWLNGTDVTREVLRRDWPVVPIRGTSAFYFEAVEPSLDIEMTVEYLIGAM